MSELCTLSALEMRQGLLRGDFTALELAQAHLGRIAETNPTFNSFLHVPAERVLEAAKAADYRVKAEKEQSPLLTGIPVAIKDNIVTAGVETTCASKILRGFIPPYDASAIVKLNGVNAPVIGKTNLDEFGMGSSTENSAFGGVKNPHDLDRVPGGSSGGSVVAVATGQAPLALGTDTGGSVRQPASLTGVLGLKPSYGRISRYGVVAYASSLDQIGPFARTLPDLAVLLGAIAGHDEKDSTSMRVPVPDYLEALEKSRDQGVKGLRIGVPKEYFIAGVDPEVEKSIKGAIANFAKLGAEIVEISLPHTEYALAVYYILAPAEASSNLARYDGVRYGHRAKGVRSLAELYERSRSEGFGPEVQRRILIGNYVLSAGYYDAYYLKAQQVRTLIINDFKAAFANTCDVIAAPVSPTTAFRLGERVNSPLQMYLADVFTIPISLAGLPALSLPVGTDSAKLPIGLQLIGPPFEESRLLNTADAYLTAHPFDTAQMTKKKW